MVRTKAPKVGDHAGGDYFNRKFQLFCSRLDAKSSLSNLIEKLVREPPMNSAQRRKLGDITNLQNQNKLVNQGAKQQQQDIFFFSKDDAENLQKENMKLRKVAVERDGIKSELHKLRINFQKVREQNLLLAQANTRILAEFNTSKDQLKVLQHELGCKNGLVMARKKLLKEQTLPCSRHASKVKSNDAGHETASETSNFNSLQINEKANNKRRVSGRTNPATLDIIRRLGETCQTGDNIDNNKLVSDGNNAAIKKEFVLDAEDHIDDNVQSKRCCAGRQSASDKNIETVQSGNLHKVVDAKEIKEDARFPLRRRSARLRSQEPEPSESYHESIETVRRRRSMMFNFQELGVIEYLNGLHDDQEIAAKAGCSASTQSIGSRPETGEPHVSKEITGKSRVSLRRQSARFNFQELGVTENLNGLHDGQAISANARCSASEQSIGSKPEAVEPHDMTETTAKSRVCPRRQSANVKTQRAIKETADPPLDDDIVDESSPISCTVSMEVKRESKNKPAGDESEEMRKATGGRPSRQAAEKIKSYKEPSLKEKMRGDL
ncbi:SHUGOSHIN 1 isoform X2 [Capsella rubella]|uniref:SHUGOSHIN 1 isoform X2 n=1 Tax=Capsella rubella TaxID=81985 RepID=UPI000CD543E8|nr:SHUGOSHIN 1 isoform X2 [Capsella rubella]